MLFLLGIVLLILKLAGVIGWAWWIVLIPFYPWLAVAGTVTVLTVLGRTTRHLRRRR